MKILNIVLTLEIIIMNCIGFGGRKYFVGAFNLIKSSSSSSSATLQRKIRLFTPTLQKFQLSTTNSDSNIFNDNQGRRIRGGSGGSDSGGGGGGGGWDDEDDNVYDDDDNDYGWGNSPSQSTRSRGNSNRNKNNNNNIRNDDSGWDDFDPFEQQPQRRRDHGYQPKSRRRQAPSSSSRGDGRGTDRGGYRDNRGGGGNYNRSSRGGSRPYYDRERRGGGGGGGGGRFSSSRYSRQNKEKDGKRSINMNALESAGFVHLYGLSSVLNALKYARRDLQTSVEKSNDINDDDWEDTDDDDDDMDYNDHHNNNKITEPPKPETLFRPYLFVQSRGSSTGAQRRGSKASAAEEVIRLAEMNNVPIAEVDKGILNSLSGNRPHQGFVLRCGHLDFEPISRIPIPDGNENPSLWLALDEVVDPQNLGALLRSAYFLGGGYRIGVLVCSKNSAPPTPVVSAASAGALEVLDVYSTSNLPRTLNQAKEDGFRVIGASSSVPKGDGDVGPDLYALQDLPVLDTDDEGQPVVLVLGSEGHGLRTLVAKACSEFVRIPAGSEDSEGGSTDVDSLNVSVTGGILLWQILNGSK